MTTPISDEELDAALDAYIKVAGWRNLHGSKAMRAAIEALIARGWSHYRSARNDGIEEAAKVAFEIGSNNPRFDVVRRQVSEEIAEAVRALKSPPQSEPGTEDVKT